MTVKTAISVDETLFEKVETLAQELSISRSRLFALAAQEFIEKHENQQALQQQMRVQHREIVEGQW